MDYRFHKKNGRVYKKNFPIYFLKTLLAALKTTIPNAYKSRHQIADRLQPNPVSKITR